MAEVDPRYLDHLRNPRNRGTLSPCDGAGKSTGPCPDVIEITVRIREDAVSEIAFETTGCEAAIACGSAVTELARGKHLDEVAEIDAETVLSAVGGLPPDQRHVAAAAAEALSNAMWDFVIHTIEKATGGI